MYGGEEFLSSGVIPNNAHAALYSNFAWVSLVRSALRTPAIGTRPRPCPLRGEALMHNTLNDLGGGAIAVKQWTVRRWEDGIALTPTVKPSFVLLGNAPDG